MPLGNDSGPSMHSAVNRDSARTSAPARTKSSRAVGTVIPGIPRRCRKLEWNEWFKAISSSSRC